MAEKIGSFVTITFQLCSKDVPLGQVHQKRVKLNGTHQLLAYTDVNSFGKK
jgi:hypothetical protein